MSYYEVIKHLKRELQRRPIRECRYDKKELKLRDLHVSDTLGVYANWLRCVARSTDVRGFGEVKEKTNVSDEGAMKE
jgi:hypothetical protein